MILVRILGGNTTDLHKSVIPATARFRIEKNGKPIDQVQTTEDVPLGADWVDFVVDVMNLTNAYAERHYLDPHWGTTKGGTRRGAKHCGVCYTGNVVEKLGVSPSGKWTKFRTLRKAAGPPRITPELTAQFADHEPSALYHAVYAKKPIVWAFDHSKLILDWAWILTPVISTAGYAWLSSDWCRGLPLADDVLLSQLAVVISPIGINVRTEPSVNAPKLRAEGFGERLDVYALNENAGSLWARIAESEWICVNYRGVPLARLQNE